MVGVFGGNGRPSQNTTNGRYTSVTPAGRRLDVCFVNHDRPASSVRTGRLRVKGRRQKHVRARAGRGERHGAGQATRIVHDANHRVERQQAVLDYGSPGGPTIINTVLLVVTNIIDQH
jgi:hypothetical protein